ncbi:MAG: DUF4159 domain-containing protein [Alphaproteobacteria bacterium]|jgi:hypothetical protein|nr:DUF4159 domain-containing protein [Alphaproteobacteria bacterium]
MGLGALTFLNPWLLLGLAAIPLIWWLLRFTPPMPKRIMFPATRLLAGLQSRERTPARSPWWLTALRILLLALAVLALSGPVLNPPGAQTAGGAPLLLVVDNGWSAASRWDARKSAMDNALDAAQRNGQTVVLAPTASVSQSWSATPATPADVRERAASLEPMPHAPDRELLASRLGETLPEEQAFDVLWLSDGADHPGTEALAARLREIGDSMTVVSDPSGQTPLGMYGYTGEDRSLRARILRPGGDAISGQVHALSARGDRLAEATYSFEAGAISTEATFELPLELRNDVAQLRIAGENSAGAVHLIDDRARWRRIGIITGEARGQAQPLLSQAYYIEKALKPYAEVISVSERNIASAVEDVLPRSPSVLILSDVGQLIGQSAAQIRNWVEDGGMLIRFAGPRLERAGDQLLPVPLRRGGRTLGGALSWSQPQKLADYPPESPFAGMAVPEDVTVKRQVLADPSGLGDADVWVRLEDGTPLVTARERGDGRLVMFHVTANSDWSNLPLSGAFVEMLRRTVAMADTARPADEGEASGDNGARETGYLMPRRIIDGFGVLGPPPPTASPLPAAGAGEAEPGPERPPGLYGPTGGAFALNVIREGAEIKPLEPISGAQMSVYQTGETVDLAPWLFMAAVAVFIIESLAILLMNLRAGGRLAGRSAAVLLALAVPFAMASDARAQDEDRRDEALALKGSLDTRLAYVITGNEEIDRISRAGLQGLSEVLASRTAVEPAEPMGLDVARDELVFFPLLYWPVPREPRPLEDETLARVDAYMKQGGMILFDTRDQNRRTFDEMGLGGAPGETGLAALIGRLDLPRLEKVPQDHVLTKSFYLLDSFPGRWDGGPLWVEARSGSAEPGQAVRADGVSSIIITSNDFAGAWARDDSGRPLYPVVPGGDMQREMAYRTGVNIVMYALTGNYKADQVHLPALLERLGQ